MVLTVHVLTDKAKDGYLGAHSFIRETSLVLPAPLQKVRVW